MEVVQDVIHLHTTLPRPNPKVLPRHLPHDDGHEPGQTSQVQQMQEIRASQGF